jgi:hypothetical protein
MRHPLWYLFIGLVLVCCLANGSFAQQVREIFEASNPTLLAARMGIKEYRAQEITAYLHPNPNFTASTDFIHPFRSYGALKDVQPVVALRYLFERMQSIRV